MDQILWNIEDHSQDLDFVDNGLDLLRGGLVKTALSHVHEISHHSTLLHKEFEKPVEQRNQKIMKTHVEEIDESRERSGDLMPSQTLEFGRKSKYGLASENNGSDLIVDNGRYLILRDESCLDPIGISLHESDEPVQSDQSMQLKPHLQTDQSVVSDNVSNVPVRVPKFETYKNIQLSNLKAIRDSGCLECAGKVYKVKFHKGTEPIIINSTPDWASKLVQFRLSRLWIIVQSRLALSQLNDVQPIDPDLPLPSFLPELQTDQVRSVADLILEENWKLLVKQTQASFKEVVTNLQKPVLDKKEALVSMFAELENEEFSDTNQRYLLLENLAKIPSIPMRQIDANSNIAFLKNMYSRLFLLARECNDHEMREIIKSRIINFNLYLEKFTTTGMGAKDIVTRGNNGQIVLGEQQAVRQMNITLKNQSKFLKYFESTEMARCLALLNPRDIFLADESRLRAPKERTLGKKLINILKEPSASWEEVQAAMMVLAGKQEEMIVTLMHQLNTANNLRQEIQTFMGHRGEGLHPDTGRSFYKPEIYARIVSLKQIRDELSDRDKLLSQGALNDKITEITSHMTEVRRETEIIRTRERSYFFNVHQMYVPELNTNGSPMNYIQWQKYQNSFVMH